MWRQPYYLPNDYNFRSQWFRNYFLYQISISSFNTSITTIIFCPVINFYSSNRRICFLSFFYINKLCFSIIKTKHKVFVNMNYSNIIYWVFFGHLWLKDNSLRFSLPKIIYYIQVDKMMCTSCRRLAYMEYTPLLVIINIYHAPIYMKWAETIWFL